MTTEENLKIYNATLLDDREVDVDEFDSQTHERIAETLKQLILKKEDGISICLLGEWGSGKSTIVNLLKLKIETTNTKVFKFDAWSHEGDPLRRSFIEKLIDFLLQSGWSKKETEDEFTAINNAINSTEERVEEYSLPQVSKYGQLALSVIMLFIPLASAFYNQALGTKIWILTPSFSFNIDYLCLSLLSLPIVAFVILYTFDCIKQKQWISLKSIAHDAIQGNASKSQYIKTKTIEVSSIEFEKLFRQILGNDAILGNKKNRVLIVIDNLDRLPAHEAISLWSTMRTFTEIERSAAPWAKNLWLIVPFAPFALQNFWKEIENSTPQDSETQKIANSFVDKTFQLKVDVPLPLLINWKKYLIDVQLKKAFSLKPELESEIDLKQKQEDDFHYIYRFIDKKRIDSNTPPTPREIKKHINSIIPYYELCGNEVPIPIISLYLLVRDSWKNPKEDILNATWLKELPYIGYSIETIKLFLASLHFKVPQSIALSLLIREPIQKALYSDSKDLSLIKEKMPDGFWIVTEDILWDEAKIWESRSLSSLIMASINIESVGNTSTHEEKACWAVIDHALSKYSKNTTFDSFNENIGAGIAATFQRCESSLNYPKLVTYLLERLSKCPTGNPEIQGRAIVEKNAKISASSWLDGALVIINHLIKNEQKEALVSHFRVPGPQLFYILVIEKLISMNLDIELHRYFVPNDGINAVLGQLSTLNSHNYVKDYSNIYQFIIAISPESDYNSLSTIFSGRISEINNLKDPGEFSYLFKCLFITAFQTISGQRQNENAINSLSTFAGNGFLLNYIGVFSLYQSNDELFAYCLVPLMLFRPGAANTQAIGHSQAGFREVEDFRRMASLPKDEVLIKQLTEIILNFNLLEELINIAVEQSAWRHIISLIVDEVLKQTSPELHISSQTLIDKYTLFINSIDQPGFTRLVQNLCNDTSKNSLDQLLLARPFDKGYLQLYLEISNNKNTYLSKVLKGLTEAEWLTLLETDLETLSQIVESQHTQNIGENLKNALSSLINTYLSKQANENEVLIIPKLVNILSNAQREAFEMELLEELFKRIKAREDVHGLVRVFKPVITNSQLLKTYIDELVEVSLHIILKNPAEELSLIHSIFTNRQDIVDLLPDRQWKRLKAILQAVFQISPFPSVDSNGEYPEAQRKRMVREIASALDITVGLDFTVNDGLLDTSKIVEIRINATPPIKQKYIRETIKCAAEVGRYEIKEPIRFNVFINDSREINTAVTLSKDARGNYKFES